MREQKTRKLNSIRGLMKTRKVRNKQMSFLAQSVLDDYRSNPKIKILEIFKGIKAFKLAKEMFFIDDIERGKKWEQEFSQSDKENAVAFIFYRKLVKNYKIGIKLIISERVNGQEWNAEDVKKILPKY